MKPCSFWRGARETTGAWSLSGSHQVGPSAIHHEGLVPSILKQYVHIYVVQDLPLLQLCRCTPLPEEIFSNKEEEEKINFENECVGIGFEY